MEYLYYSVGFLHYKEAEIKYKNEVLEYISYQFADLKTLLFDIDSGVRGLGGCKQPFDYKNLPSHDRYNKNESTQINENETEEERLERHRKFFESLKSMVNS